MAKQTFTTGQVLTAAQMTSLQQTAMGGGSPVTKTASYVLVAADAGTVIQMNSASSTTITVNTALFAAGDSVQIQNIGAGVCTITAGTATVTTAGSLALTQWEGGVLYFTSTSASIFFDYIQAGVSIPLTTKGDLFGYSTTNARIPIGTDNQVLTADSTQALGLKWATSASGGGMTLINSGGTALSGLSTTTITLSGTYKDLLIQGVGIYNSTNANLCLRFNSDSTNNYISRNVRNAGTSGTLSGGIDTATNGYLGQFGNFTAYDEIGRLKVQVPRYGETSYKMIISDFAAREGSAAAWTEKIISWNNTAAITTLTIFTDAGTFSGGTIYVYGVN